jgi:hypothetical protein
MSTLPVQPIQQKVEGLGNNAKQLHVNTILDAIFLGHAESKAGKPLPGIVVLCARLHLPTIFHHVLFLPTLIGLMSNSAGSQRQIYGHGAQFDLGWVLE